MTAGATAAATTTTLTTITSSFSTLPIWSEEFNYDGPPDPTIWSYDLGTNRSNQELETYTSLPENVVVVNGTLRIIGRRRRRRSIKVSKNNNNKLTIPWLFTSARITTLNKVTMKYGRLEASIQIPNLANGLWPAFWMEGNTNRSHVVWPHCGEIDIMEMGSSTGIAKGTVNRRVSSTAHWYDTITQSHAHNGHSLETPTNLNSTAASAFHNFTLDWTPSALTTYVDGAMIWTMDITTTTTTAAANNQYSNGTAFHQPYFILLNLAIGGDYPGIYNHTGITAPFPAEFITDYIRIYANEWTELGGTYFSTTKATTMSSTQ